MRALRVRRGRAARSWSPGHSSPGLGFRTVTGRLPAIATERRELRCQCVGAGALVLGAGALVLLERGPGPRARCIVRKSQRPAFVGHEPGARELRLNWLVTAMAADQDAGVGSRPKL